MSNEYVPPPIPPEVQWSLPKPRLKFQHPWRRHILFFLATVVTTTTSGWLPDVFFGALGGVFSNPVPSVVAWVFTVGVVNLTSWAVIKQGLWYSIPALTILGAHEFGHYGYCRKYNVDATLPYFLPAPVLTGTLGAVIRIKEPFPSKKALFDIGIAGPIAGFLMLLPFLYFGIAWSQLVPKATANGIPLGEPLLLKAMSWWHFGKLGPETEVVLHPMAFAAWFGTIATALNLLPFGQLDGGHIAYAALGKRSAWASIGTLAVVIALAFVTPSWVLWAVVLTAMAYLVGFSHPRIYDEHEPLDGKRIAVAVFALLMLIVCFTPFPIQAFWGG